MHAPKTYILLALPGLIWGFQPITLKLLLPYWSPATVAAVRFLIVGIAVLLYQAVKNHWQWHRLIPKGMDCLWILFMGIMGQMLNNIFAFYGLTLTTVTNSTLITAMTPTITAVFAYFLLREKLTRTQWAGILLSFSGVFMVITQGHLLQIKTMAFNPGDIFCLLGQVCWALYTLASRKLSGHFDLLTALGWCSLIGSGGTYLYGCYTGTFHIVPLPELPLVCYFYVVLLGGIVANVAWNEGVRKVGPSKTAVFLNIMPVVGMISGWLIFHDSLGLLQLSGAVLIFLGVWLTTTTRHIKI